MNSPLRQALLMTAVLVSLGLCQPRADAATLLLRYHFDESSSGSAPAEDAGSGTPAPGTFVGGATRTANTPAGFSTGALDLTAPGAGTYVDGGDATKLDPQESFTLTAWINLQGTPSGNLRIMSKQGGSTFPGFSWNIADPLSESGPRSAANFGLRLFVGGSNGFLFDPAPSGLSIDADNKWAFIAVTYAGDLSDANVNYYVGSADRKVQLASTTTINAGVVLDSSAKFGIGYTDAAPAADTAPPGFLDDVRVYAGTLSTQELEAVRQANIPEPSTAGLLLAGVLAGAGLGCRRMTRQLE